MLAFLFQAATGLARMYIETPWGRWLSGLFGGYETAKTIHVNIGIAMLCGMLVHVVYLLIKIDWMNLSRSVAGPDSLLPQPKDIKEFFQHIGWFLGAGKAPPFDRWGYWEKFDYWAVFWGMVIIGITGLMMAFPFTSSRVMPGWALNVAFWIHRIEALLAMAHVFIIHFFIAHLRRHNFPMDRAMFEGSVDLAATRHEKPSWVARLEKAGELERSLVSEAPVVQRAIFYVFGYAAVLIGVFLLLGGLINSPDITW